MKKLLQILVLMIATALPAVAINPYLQGDVNDDSRVNINDVVDLINTLLTGTTSSLDGYGDVNGDGRENINDVVDLINILLRGEDANENTVSVTLPDEAPITVNDVVVMGYGNEIAPSNNPRHLREAGKRYYVTDANVINVLTRDGKLVYDCYVSLDINNHERSVAVDAMETAYTMLIPMFSDVFDATPDYVYTDLKNLLAELDETQALAAAIDNSIVRHGYFEIDDVETEYHAAVEKIIDKLGLRDNFMSDTSRDGVSFKTPSEPSIPYGEYGHRGLKLRLNSSEWIPDTDPGGGGGGSWLTGRDSAFESYGGTWHCNLTAYNSGRFAYTSWTRGYIDDNGRVRPYSDAPADLLEHILKPQRVATFMKTFKTWSGLKDYFSDSWKLITEPDFGFADMTWDCTKVKFDMDFTTPMDVVIVCGPDQQVMLFYNLLKAIVEPATKELFKNLDKASKEEGEFFTIFCAELVMDLEYSTRFTAIWQGDGSLGEKAKAIAELTWPKLKKSAKKYFQERADLWGKDRCIEIFGFVDVAKLETGIENITKNMNKYLKVVQEVGDGLLSCFGVIEALNDVYGSGYYQMNLDFNDIPINIKKFIVGDVTFTMVEVKGGSFQMGASMEQINDAHDNEYPLHNVTLGDYYIGQTEVTQELWKAVMGSVPGTHKNPKYPVGGVSWLECQQFISKLNEMTGENFRLPTEAEWEFAARGGDGALARLYAGSDNVGNVAWYKDNSSSRPHAVVTKNPNRLTLYDMSGNAMEWCSDWYGAYSSDAQTNPTGPADGTQRVCRGGGWGYGSDLCRVSCRNSFAPGNSMNENLGLRLVWTPKCDVTEGLVAYYPFNGDANDESGYGNHGTVYGNVVLTNDRYGNPNSAYSFPGQPFNYIAAPDNEMLHCSIFTLNAWIYSDTGDYGYAGGFLINKGRDIENGSYSLRANCVNAQNDYYGCNGAYMDGYPEAGTWHMLTGTVEGDKAKFYVDGVLINENTLSHPFVYGNSQPLTLGMHYYGGVPSGWAYPYIGILDDVRIYNRVLTPDEILFLYRN